MRETAVASRDNPIFRRLKKLAASARARREACATLLDGEHLLAAYLDAGGQPRTLVRAVSFAAAKLAPFSVRCTQARLLLLPDALVAELTPVATPGGLIAEADWLSPPVPEGVPLVVALEDVRDPGNVGAMLRTAAAAGATGAVLSKGCHDPWSPKALRGGQGAQFVLPVETGVDLPDWLRRFEGDSLALALGGDGSLYGQVLTGPLALVVGNEGAGLSATACAAARARVRIPMRGKVESLNAAAALAVALFEAARQRAGAEDFYSARSP